MSEFAGSLALDDRSLALDGSSFAVDTRSWHLPVATGNGRVLLHVERDLRGSGPRLASGAHTAGPAGADGAVFACGTQASHERAGARWSVVECRCCNHAAMKGLARVD
jgi:hypothetical protein